MTTYIPWFLTEAGDILTQEDGENLLIDGELVVVIPPVDPGDPDPPPPPPDYGPPGELHWNIVGERRFEAGVDRGVLYPQRGAAVPWNGLTSVTEKFNQELESVYFDGMKINDLVSLGDYEGKIKAFSYPEKFSEIEGMSEINTGMFLGNQKPQVFGLSYRTGVGTDNDPGAGYKIHLLYNITAVPTDREHNTLTETADLTEFEWDITAIPEEVDGHRPTAHVVINSLDFDATLLGALEALIYGTATTPPKLLPLVDMLNYLNDWFSVRIVDNGDGTWTAFSTRPAVITFPADPTIFEINNVNGVYLDADTYQISSTFA